MFFEVCVSKKCDDDVFEMMRSLELIILWQGVTFLEEEKERERERQSESEREREIEKVQDRIQITLNRKSCHSHTWVNIRK